MRHRLPTVCILASLVTACAAHQPVASAPARPTPPPPASVVPGTLDVLATPSGTTVIVDGVPRGATPLKVELPPGEHLVVLQNSGANSQPIPVTITSGKTTTVKQRMPMLLQRRRASHRYEALKTCFSGAKRGYLTARVSYLRGRVYGVRVTRGRASEGEVRCMRNMLMGTGHGLGIDALFFRTIRLRFTPPRPLPRQT